MPNWCENSVSVYANKKTIERIRNFVRSEESEFDFNNIIPMPEHIYTGILGPEERKKYGKDNWYDWSIENWGTKWNSGEATFDHNYISFLSAWSPASPVVAKLANLFPDAEFWYQYEEPGMAFCGVEYYRNGSCVYYMSSDICHNYDALYESDDDNSDDNLIVDDLYPALPDGIHVDACADGSIHIRTYTNGKLYERIDGIYVDHRPADESKVYWNEESNYHMLSKSAA